DGLTWTFTLRDGVKMHDGSTFTARDVATSIDRVLTDKAVNARQSGRDFSNRIADVKIIDDGHVAITTKAPYAFVLNEGFLPPPIPTDYLKKVGSESFTKEPLAAGAFRFLSQKINQEMIYERFDDFWDKSRLPNFKTAK